MKCAELEKFIFEYLENKLAHSVKEEFEAHILNCLNCRKYIDETIKCITLFRQLREIPCPEEVDKKIKYHLD